MHTWLLVYQGRLPWKYTSSSSDCIHVPWYYSVIIPWYYSISLKVTAVPSHWLPLNNNKHSSRNMPRANSMPGDPNSETISLEQAQRWDRGPEVGQGLVLNQCSYSTLTCMPLCDFASNQKYTHMPIWPLHDMAYLLHGWLLLSDNS